MICDKEYRIPYELYAHFLCDKLEYYFIKEEYIHFRNYQSKKSKNGKTLYVRDLIKNLFLNLKN